MPEVYITPFYLNSRARIQESKEILAACPSYAYKLLAGLFIGIPLLILLVALGAAVVPVLVMAVLAVLVVAPIVLAAKTIF
jgi:hypothetical protein